MNENEAEIVEFFMTCTFVVGFLAGALVYWAFTWN